MTILSEQPVSCPYCGEGITVLVDQSLPDLAQGRPVERDIKPVSYSKKKGD